MLNNFILLEDIEVTFHIPPRILLINVLERSLNDLFVEDPKIRKGAYTWFTEDVRGLPRWVSFRDVKEHIVLDAYKSKFIREAVAKYEASLEKE